MHVPASPSELCDLLRIAYSERQDDLMFGLGRANGVVDERLEDADWAGDPLRATMMVVLWRILACPGSRATILAPSREGSTLCADVGHLAMSFLNEVCLTRDVCLRSITTPRAWNRLEFVGEPGWEVRLTPNCPVMVAEAASRSLIGVVLDAGCSQPAFVEAQKALEAVARDPRGLLIRLW
jgi:hypothetical protein